MATTVKESIARITIEFDPSGKATARKYMADDLFTDDGIHRARHLRPPEAVAITDLNGLMDSNHAQMVVALSVANAAMGEAVKTVQKAVGERDEANKRVHNHRAAIADLTEAWRDALSAKAKE